MKPKPNKEEENKMFRETDTPKIYVACLAAYNNGILHGEWIDATQDIDDIWKEIAAMLETSPEEDSEEHAIHDYDNFESLPLGEYEGIDRVHEIARFIEEHGELGTKLLAHFICNIEEAERAIESYIGCYRSLEDYAISWLEETTEIPKHLAFYINYEAIVRDIEINGDVFTIESGYEEVHVFANN